MLLKSYLQSLINALLNRSVENASPAGEATSTMTVTSGQTVVSPVDGFAVVESSQATASGAYVSIMASIKHQHLNGNGYVGHLHVPVKKGENVQVHFLYLSTGAVLRFVSRIGGGCLKLIFELLSTVFSKEAAYA